MTSEAVLDLIDAAWEADSPASRASFARQAVEQDPNALDAYVALSTVAETSIERLAILREAVRRGDRIWGEAAKRPEADFFWYDHDTRPWMRAMNILALALWESDERPDAVALLDKLLRLQPNDSLGARYAAMSWHAVLGNWAAVEKLLRSCAKHDDAGAAYAWTLLLNDVRLGRATDKPLAEALECNPHVPGFLLASAHSAFEGDSYSPGSPEEAHIYADFGRDAWRVVPGALEWLRTASPTPRRRKR